MIVLRFPKTICILLLILLLIGCSAPQQPVQVAATTGPVAQFANAITEGTGITVAQVINDSISCLHDYSLSVRQMEVLTGSRIVLISGAGLEESMEDVLESAEAVTDCSVGVPMLEMNGHAHEEHDHEHHHEHDPHIWLSPANAAIMAENICAALTAEYPEHEAVFQANTEILTAKLQELQAYGEQQLADLSCRELVTFHDGFAYFAHAFGLEIAAAIEEESGSEASAADLIEIIGIMEHHGVPAVFTEINGSASAAAILEAEIGIPSYPLDMAMNTDYFTAMKQNIDTLKEALQ